MSSFGLSSSDEQELAALAATGAPELESSRPPPQETLSANEERARNIAISVKLSAPKKLLQNERSMLRWMERILEIGAIATFLLSWLSSSGLKFSIALWSIVFVLLIYAALRYRMRLDVMAGVLRGPPSNPFRYYVDYFGPLFLGVTLFISIAVFIFVLGVKNKPSGP